MEENPNRILLYVTLAVVLIGGIVLWALVSARHRQPVFGWHTLGTETFDLKASAYRGFSYRDLPAKFRVQVQASDPVSFGFVTPDIYGHYTATPMQLDFSTLPCGANSGTHLDLNCTTESSKRYLLLTDTREDAIPDSATRTPRMQKAAAEAPSTLPPNHITITMYDWRCLQYCENLPKPSPTAG